MYTQLYIKSSTWKIKKIEKSGKQKLIHRNNICKTIIYIINPAFWKKWNIYRKMKQTFDKILNNAGIDEYQQREGEQ